MIIRNVEMSFYTGVMTFLSPNQQRQYTEDTDRKKCNKMQEVSSDMENK